MAVDGSAVELLPSHGVLHELVPFHFLAVCIDILIHVLQVSSTIVDIEELLPHDPISYARRVM